MPNGGQGDEPQGVKAEHVVLLVVFSMNVYVFKGKTIGVALPHRYKCASISTNPHLRKRIKSLAGHIKTPGRSAPCIRFFLNKNIGGVT